MVTLLKAKAGIPMVGNLVTLTVAANAGAQAVYQVSTAAAMRGTKSFKLKRIVIRDTTAGGTNVHFGTGAAGAVVDAIPQMRTVANMEVIQEWDDELAPEFTADLMAYADAVQVEIQVSVQEIG
jgi:hypothetical protein